VQSITRPAMIQNLHELTAPTYQWLRLWVLHQTAHRRFTAYK
jgi:hypothetical protein